MQARMLVDFIITLLNVLSFVRLQGGKRKHLYAFFILFLYFLFLGWILVVVCCHFLPALGTDVRISSRSGLAACISFSFLLLFSIVLNRNPFLFYLLFWWMFCLLLCSLLTAILFQYLEHFSAWIPGIHSSHGEFLS